MHCLQYTESGKLMKFTINKKQFHEGIASVSRAVAAKTTLPILNNIMVSVKDNVLYLEATDLEIGLTHSMAVEGATPGATTVPGKLLMEIVGSLPNDTELTVLTDDRHKLTISAGKKSSYGLHGLPAEDYPNIPKIDSIAELTFKGSDLASLIKTTLVSTSADESRAILTGILIKWDGDKVTGCSTDTHRLTVKHVIATGAMTDNTGECIIPSRAMTEALRMAEKADTVDVRIGENQISFTAGNSCLVSRKIEGQFPLYEKVIPKIAATFVDVHRMQLLNAVKRCSIVARQESCRVIFSIEGDLTPSLLLNAQTAEVGSANEEVQLESCDGDKLAFAMNSDYVTSMLAVIESDIIHLSLKTALSPMMITIEGDDSYCAVVMPMQMLD
jgi:DNA polymerase-3 subunit beta